MKGIYGNEKVMRYYEENKKSVENIRKWDILNLEKIYLDGCYKFHMIS